MRHGKKVAKHLFITELGSYNLDIRLEVADSLFIILVPASPDAKVSPSDWSSFTRFADQSLDKLKTDVRKFLNDRDHAEYEDVIEYNLHESFGREKTIGFDFRVARVSKSLNRNGEPLTEKMIEVGEDGDISLSKDMRDEPYRTQAYRRLHTNRIPFTKDRWRKCCAIQDGVARLHTMLHEMFDGEQVVDRLDAIPYFSSYQLLSMEK